MKKLFPGMNPYLEDPFYWHGFHNSLIYCLHAALNSTLPEGYTANIEQRLSIVPPERDIYPDVLVTRSPLVPTRTKGDGAAVLERGLPDLIISTLSPEIYDWYIEIRTIKKPRQVVTIIELLSPSNKEPGSEGRREYRLKQQDILRSDTNLMEIDLLRGGSHTVAVSFETLREHGRAWDYLICLHRVLNRGSFECWLRQLSEPLPEVRVPLLGDTPDVLLDIQAAFDQAFAEGRYDDKLDYSDPLTPPLSAQDSAWVVSRIDEWHKNSKP